MKLRVTKISALAVAVFAVALSGIPAMAMVPSSNRVNALDTQTSTGQPASPGSQGSTKLAAAKLKSCQKRQTAITNVMSRIADRSQKQLDLFTTIATKTEAFYTEKGKTLSNYDALVADVATNKEAAQTTVQDVSTSSTTFSCDGTDPKGVVTSFKKSLKTEITALKAYKTSVKNLIVGVKSVQGATTSADAKTTGGAQ